MTQDKPSTTAREKLLRIFFFKGVVPELKNQKNNKANINLLICKYYVAMNQSYEIYTSDTSYKKEFLLISNQFILIKVWTWTCFKPGTFIYGSVTYLFRLGFAQQMVWEKNTSRDVLKHNMTARGSKKPHNIGRFGSNLPALSRDANQQLKQYKTKTEREILGYAYWVCVSNVLHSKMFSLPPIL